MSTRAAAVQALKKLVCEDDPECLSSFNKTARAWSGDVNGDSVREILIQPGRSFAGSGGATYFLFAVKGNEFRRLFEWRASIPRFDILPIARSGFRDLCLQERHCVKWDGEGYIEYDPEDYRRLSSRFFDSRSPWDAEMLWLVRYAGLEAFTFTPQWLAVVPKDLKDSAMAEATDQESGTRFVAAFKGGVWAFSHGRGYLLLPRVGWYGAQRLRLDGDWLLVYDTEAEGAAPVARFNRRNGGMQLREFFYWND